MKQNIIATLLLLIVPFLSVEVHASEDLYKKLELHKNKIVSGKELLLKRLNNVGWVPDGKGSPLYVYSSIHCVYCQRLWDDLVSGETSQKGLQFRWIKFARNKDGQAHVASTRSLYDLNELMQTHRIKNAKDHRRSQKLVDAYNNVILTGRAIGKVVVASGKKMTGGTPTFIWKDKGEWYTAAGYKNSPYFKDLFKYISSIKS